MALAIAIGERSAPTTTTITMLRCARAVEGEFYSTFHLLCRVLSYLSVSTMVLPYAYNASRVCRAVVVVFSFSFRLHFSFAARCFVPAIACLLLEFLLLSQCVASSSSSSSQKVEGNGSQ